MSMFHELMMRKKEQIMYATIKGTLTENDGVFNGFAYNNYLATQEVLDTSKDFEIVLKVNTGNIQYNTDLRIIARNSFGSSAGQTGFAFGIRGSNKQVQTFIIDSSGNQFVNGTLGTTVFDSDTDYFFKFSQKANNDTYIIKIESSTDGINWTTEKSWTHNLPIRNSGQGVAFGGGNLSQTTQYWAGSIDLPNSYIKIKSTKYKLQAVVGYTVVGSPTITDGVVSGFVNTGGNYLKIDSANALSQADSWEIVIKISGEKSGSYIIGSNSNTIITISLGTGKIYLSSNGSSWDIASGVGSGSIPNDSYCRLKFTGTQYILDNSLDKNTWTTNATVTSSTKITSSLTYLKIGAWQTGQTSNFVGSIDLNNTYIKINNKLWFNGQQA